MRFFIAGIMQGSRADKQLHGQDYRGRLREMLSGHFPTAEIYDPLADHGQSVSYDNDTGRRVFYGHNRMCREVDAVFAYIPQASMGTAIEMWEAHEHGCGVVITISPLRDNWVVKFCSHAVYDDLEALATGLSRGEIERLIRSKMGPQSS